ncbi:MAG: hypothetical protein OJF60_003192 [Burkholderiaceae bacterium]|nr:MAG: hypothetical protein OJF60_003192 [Burkholderiaceae bacterium]
MRVEQDGLGVPVLGCIFYEVEPARGRALRNARRANEGPADASTVGGRFFTMKLH